MGVRLSGGRWAGSVPSVPAKCWYEPHAGQYDTQHPQRKSGTCVWGFARRGLGSWGAVGPTFGFSQGRGVTLEPPAAVPRAGWQEPVARPRRTEAQGGRPGPDHQSHGDWRDRPHLRDQRRRRPEGVSSDLWVCARVTLQAASRRLDPPSGALPGTSQISAPHDARCVPLAPAALPC